VIVVDEVDKSLVVRLRGDKRRQLLNQLRVGMVLQLLGNDVLIEASAGFSSELGMEDESVVVAVQRNQRSLRAIGAGSAVGLVRCLARAEIDLIVAELPSPVHRRTYRGAG